MNRLSFLKKLSTGIAIAVITPKVLADIPDKPKEYDLAKPPYWDDLKEKYGHFEEDFPKYTVDQLRIHDLCLDKDARQWLCTGILFDGSINLMAILAKPEPNFVNIRRDSFDEYFIIFGNAFIS